MATSRDSGVGQGGALELKGRMSTLTVLRLLVADHASVLAGLDKRIADAPAMFTGMPVVIDASALPAWPDEGAVQELIAGLRERGLVPVALSGEVDAGMAARVGLGVLPEAASAAPREASTTAEAESITAARPASRIVDQPVRSGQQVYARGGDLVITATVSPGAEVLADGHIHVYGALNGRAMAGVQGDTSACILCRRFNAELVAIAGRYQVSDHITDGDRGGEVRIALRDEELTIEPLPASAEPFK